MRPLYTTASLLSARDLNDEQADRIKWLRRHDRFTHGAGRVCGLHVYAAPERLRPWLIGVCPGYAVTPCGDEIDVQARVLVDIREFSWSRPHVNGIGARLAFVGLRFADEAGPDESGGSTGECGCGCGCSSAAQSDDSSLRLHDGYAIEILWTFERNPAVPVDLCKPGPVPCPPPGLYVILASVRIPALESTPIGDADILEL